MSDKLVSATTPWEPMMPSQKTMKYIGMHYHLWSRLYDGIQIFTIRRIDNAPKEGDGGYMSIAAAAKAKGMR